MRPPILICFYRYEQVERVSLCFDPVLDLVNNSPPPVASPKGGLLHGWPLTEKQVIVSGARNEQAAGIQFGCHGLDGVNPLAGSKVWEGVIQGGNDIELVSEISRRLSCRIRKT